MNLKRKYSALSVMKIDSANSSNHFDKTSHSVTFKSNPTSYVKIAMSRPPLLKKNFIQEKVLPIIEKTRELSEQIVLERATITGHFRIIGQVWNKLIIAVDCKKGILLAFDQHAVHERVRYEYFTSKLLNQINSDPTETHFKKFDPKIINYKKPNAETVLVPKKIPKSGKSWLHLPSNLLQRVSTLSNFGFNYDLTNEKNDHSTKIEFTTSPAILGEEIPIDVVPNLLLDLRNDIKPIADKLPKAINQVLMSKSCKNAIKFNDELNHETALEMIGQLRHCNHPFYCIHGRNSVYPLCELKNVAKLMKSDLRANRKIDWKRLVVEC